MTCVNIDWLSFSLIMNLDKYEIVHGAEFSTPIGYQLKEYTGTNMYKRRHILYTYDGEKVLTMLSQPHSKIIHPASLFVEVANKYLYSDIGKVLELLPLIHESRWQSLSRLDICGDFNPNNRQEFAIEKLASGEYYVTGKREGAQWHDYHRHEGSTSKVERLPRQLSWGSKYSDFKVKLYNKTLEIYQPTASGALWCSKPYIADMWRANGIDPKRAWRLEWSITSASQYERDGQRLDLTVIDPHKFTQLFWDLTSTRFVPRINEGHAAKRYDKIVDFLDIPDEQHQRIRHVDPSSSRHLTEHAATVRALVKELGREEVRLNPAIRSSLLATTTEIIKTAHLDSYILHALGRDWPTWVEGYEQGEYIPF